MNTKFIALSRRYAAALGRHLMRSRLGASCMSRSSLEAAHGLGRQASAMGLETLDMARIHERCLLPLKGSIARKRKVRLDQASAFFAEAINPIEETHLATRKARAREAHLKETLCVRAVELATRNRQLKQKVRRRKRAEADLRTTGEHQKKALKESLQLQERLRRLTHKLLLAQENERNTIGRELRDEVAQTLLGIKVRMLALKAGAAGGSNGFQREVASAQQVVATSAKMMHRVARGIVQTRAPSYRKAGA